jgi:putative iron-dependent peroxidase
MAVPQAGIFALGTLAHSFMQFDLAPAADPAALIARAAAVYEPRTARGGVNLVVGFRPELWSAAVRRSAPRHAISFSDPVVGPDGYTMPATQHDLLIWIAGGGYDVVFDHAGETVARLREVATISDETPGWSYHRDRDLTGFIDGTENPSLSVAPSMVLVPEGRPGAGGSVLLLQKWRHDPVWERLSRADQERVMGRRKADSVEFEDRAPTSHSARTDQDHFGRIFRRNTAYGSVLDHGTMFVGFSDATQPLAGMLRSMAGIGGPRDALTYYARPLTGAYYFVPSVNDLETCARAGGG